MKNEELRRAHCEVWRARHKLKKLVARRERHFAELRETAKTPAERWEVERFIQWAKE